MNKKGGFNIQNYMLTFLLVIGVLITLGLAAAGIGSTYSSMTNVTVDSSFSNTYDKLDEIADESEQLQDQIISGGTGDQNAAALFLGETLSAVKIVFQSFTASRDMITDFVTTLGIPVIWYQIFIISLVILIVTTIVFMVFKSKGE